MSRLVVFGCILSSVLVLLGPLTGCSEEYDDVTLDLYSLILPGTTDTQTEVIAKFTWRGGG